jgi:transposase
MTPTPTAAAAAASIEPSIDWQALPAKLRAAVQTALQLRDQRIAALQAELTMLKAQLDWFRRQVFGSKSERHVADLAQQLPLGGLQAPVPEVPDTDEPASVVVKRRKARSDFAADVLERSFFDAQRVEVVPIEVPNDAVADLSPQQYEVVGVKTSHRLAQRPGSYVVLEYRRSVIKRHDSGTLHCPPAPQGVFEGSRADVSFAVGLLVDKFCWHLPLYRQHQRLLAAGFKLSRQWLTQLVQQAGRLLEPIYQAQLESIRASRVKAADETPIKAGHAGPGRMRSAYYWPIYGEQDEVCFVYRESRRHEHADEVLGPALPGMVLLSDGYGAYKSWARKSGAVHAECWVHTRRQFFEARQAAPPQAEHALRLIGKIYEVEQEIRQRGLKGPDKRRHRQTHAKPCVERFFAWVDEQLASQGLLPSNRLTQALHYARVRREALQVFLNDPEVAPDTNHLERALRVIPMGRRNWLFCWSEVGAEIVGIVQSLIVTCKLHDIDPATYLTDVLQRVGQHPASRVAELTPRLWKKLFADNPLRSDLSTVPATTRPSVGQAA